MPTTLPLRLAPPSARASDVSESDLAEMLAGAGGLAALALAAMVALALVLRAAGADPGAIAPIAGPAAWAVFTA